MRSSNEDRCAVSGSEDSLKSWQGELSIDSGWALVADGVGGHVAGEVAASIAIEVLRPMMGQLRGDEDIQQAVNAADRAIMMAMEMRPELRGMATTIAGVVLGPDGILAFNVGDTRVYAFDDGLLEQVSTDDATRNGALLQCLGGFQEPVPLLVHVRRVRPEANMLLCSDGLTDMLQDEQIARVLNENPEQPAQALVRSALTAGGHDNVSVIVIQA